MSKDIDTDLSPNQKDNIMNALREYYGEDNVLNCIAFKTETLKAAILSGMRALGYTIEEAQTLSAIIPVDRGHVYTLKECEEGDDDLGYVKAPEVVEKIKSYPNLYETLQKIEGLQLNASIHASAVYIFNNGYLEHVGLMRAPNGTKVTCFDMDDVNSCSGLKIDLLFTNAQDKLMKTMDLLLKDGIIQWQGSLRATYNKYLHPDVLDYDNVKMWENASNGRVCSLFQWETAVGGTAIKKTQPRSIMEMATVNSAIRVKSDGEIQPIDRYNMFHRNINLWYDEMKQAGLNNEEIEIMKKYLLPASGCSLQQEDFMRLVMEPKISGYPLADSNALRKAIAHKILDVLAKQKSKFHEACKQQGTRIEMANYVWDYCIQPLASYSFSIIHSVLYSIIALQEMNLATKYNSLYWSCASLCIDAGSADVDNLNEEEELGDEEDNGGIDVNHATADYKKIGKAIGNIQTQGVKISPPDINRASIDFVPDIENNAIIYGFLGVKDVNEDLINKIIAGRPYSSSLDFYTRIQPTNTQMISLIKAGAFDAVDKKNRLAIMDQYLRTKAEESIKLKDSMTAANIKKAVELKVLPNDKYDLLRLYNFNKWIEAHQYSKERKRYEFDDADVIRYFAQELKHLFAPTDYYEMDGKIMVVKKAMTAVYKTKIQPLFDWLNSKEGCQAFYEAQITQAIQEQKDKYCQGDLSTWEFDALTCYMGTHELSKANVGKYGIVDFNTLPEQLKPIGTKINQRSGKEYNVYDVVRIAGTVIGTDNNKHILTLSTPYGVVDVKFYKEEYIYYNKNISQMVTDSKGKTTKTTIEKSWFTRGNKLLIAGVRRENMFIPKKNWDKGYTHTVELIVQAGYDLELKPKRASVEE